MLSPNAAVDWHGLVAKAGRIPEILEVLAEIVLGEALLASGALGRIGGSRHASWSRRPACLFGAPALADR